jgi:hypothetical protein
MRAVRIRARMTRLLIAGGEVLVSSMQLLRADVVVDQRRG